MHAVFPDATLYVPAAHAVQHVGEPVAAFPPKPALQVQPVTEVVPTVEFEPVGQHMHWYFVLLLHPSNEYVPAPHELRVSEQLFMELAQLFLLLPQVCAVGLCISRRSRKILRAPWASAPWTGGVMPSVYPQLYLFRPRDAANSVL